MIYIPLAYALLPSIYPHTSPPYPPQHPHHPIKKFKAQNPTTPKISGYNISPLQQIADTMPPTGTIERTIEELIQAHNALYIRQQAA